MQVVNVCRFLSFLSKLIAMIIIYNIIKYTVVIVVWTVHLNTTRPDQKRYHRNLNRSEKHRNIL